MTLQLLDRALVAQLATMVFRPIAFILSVGYLSGRDWADWYLLVLGLMPLFAILDVFFQSTARHSFLAGRVSPVVPNVFVLYVVGIFLLLPIAIYRSYQTSEYCGIVAALVAVYALAAFANRYEPAISSSRAVFELAGVELIGYILCAVLVALGAFFYAAALATMVFPIARLCTVVRHRRNRPSAPESPSPATSRSGYISSSVSTQVFASFAAGAPSVVALSVPGVMERIGATLIAFKLLFAFSALFSTLFNVIGVRVFYGVVRLEMSEGVSTIRGYERKALGSFFVFFCVLVVLIPFVSLSALILAAGFCVAFSYFNVVSSLALMRGRPFRSAQAQAAVCAGSFALALFVNGKPWLSVACVLIFLFVGIALARRVRLSDMLAG
jgi:hypothetical protein